MGNRLFVGNLSFNTSRESVEQAFAAIGEVKEIAMPTDRETGQPRGFAFVTMGTSEAAAAAIQQLHGSVLDGRTIKVDEAQERPQLMPRPTRYVPQMVALVEKLIRKGHAYVASDGVVYFDVRSCPDYGQLSGNTLDSLREAAGGRVRAETQAVKRHPVRGIYLRDAWLDEPQRRTP